MLHHSTLSDPKPGNQHHDNENQYLAVLGIQVCIVSQGVSCMWVREKENQSVSSVPFSSGKYLPALIHETELSRYFWLWHGGIRSILTIKSESRD